MIARFWLGLLISLGAASALKAQVTPLNQTCVINIGATPLTADFSPGSTFTMEGWFFLTSYSERAWLMGKEQATGGDPFLSFGLTFGGGDGTKLQFACSTGVVGSIRGISSPGALLLRTWVHCAAVMDGTIIRLLINGQVVATGTALGPPPKLDDVAFGIGRAFFADGSLSYGAIALWLMNDNTPLSASLIGTVGLERQIFSTGDLNNDGQTDIIWRNMNNGNAALWLMNGNVPQSAVVISSIPLNWQICN